MPRFVSPASSLNPVRHLRDSQGNAYDWLIECVLLAGDASSQSLHECDVSLHDLDASSSITIGGAGREQPTDNSSRITSSVNRNLIASKFREPIFPK